MKRLIAAGVLAVFVIIICIISGKAVRATVKSANDAVDKCLILFSRGDFYEAKQAAYEFKESWKTRSGIISLFSNHCNLDDIKILAATLPDAAESKNSYEFNCAANKIKFALDMIYKEHSFYFENMY